MVDATVRVTTQKELSPTSSGSDGQYQLSGVQLNRQWLKFTAGFHKDLPVPVDMAPERGAYKDVKMERSPADVKTALGLQEQFRTKNFEALATTLNRYAGYCEEDEEVTCRLVRQAKVQLASKNYEAVGATLQALRDAARETNEAPGGGLGAATAPCASRSGQPAPPGSIVKDHENGITVGQTKVYDERSFRQKIRALEASLASLRFLNQGGVAGAAGRIQGARLDTSSLGVSVSALPVPGVATTTNTGATETSTEVVTQSNTPSTVTTLNTVSPNTTSQVVTQPPVTAAAPGLPAQTAALTLQQPVGLSAQEVLVEQVLLQQQVAEMQLFLESSLTDRVFAFRPDDKGYAQVGQRKSSIFGFWVTLDPGRRRDAVAEVEIVLNSECQVRSESGALQQEPASLVLLLPREKTYNVATATKDSKALNAGVVLKVITAGVSAGRTSETLYIVGDTDTVSMERRRPNSGEAVQVLDSSITFGWQFRPVLGRETVAPGTRQVYALVALPKDAGTHGRPFVGTIRAYTRWRRFDSKKKTVGEVIRGSESYRNLNNLEVGPEQAETVLAPGVSEVSWEEAGGGQILVKATGYNFLDGVGVLAGGRAMTGPETGLTVQDDRNLLLLLPAQLLAQVRNPLVLGRYGEPRPLVQHTPPGRKSQPGYGMKIVSAVATPIDAQNSKVVVTVQARRGGGGGGSTPLNPVVLSEDYFTSPGSVIYASRPVNPILIVGARAFGFSDSPVVRDAGGADGEKLTFFAPTAALRQAQKLGVWELFESADYYDERPITFQPVFAATRAAVAFADDTVTQLAISGSGFDPCKQIRVLVGKQQFIRPPDACPSGAAAPGPDDGAKPVNFLSPSMLAVNVPRQYVSAAKQIFVFQDGASAPAMISLAAQPSPEPTVDKQEVLVEGDVKTVKLAGSNLNSISEIRFEGQGLRFEAAEDGASLDLTTTAAVTASAGDKQVNFVLKDGKVKSHLLKVQRRN